MEHYVNEPLLDMFIFETANLVGQLENIILSSEKSNCFAQDDINEIFRIMHTIKGSSAMMSFNRISGLAHSVEDSFYYLREEKPEKIDCTSLSDLILESIDFIKIELEKIKNGDEADGDAAGLITKLKTFLSTLKQNGNTYKTVIFFDDGCEMENIRAFSIVHNLGKFAHEISHTPADIIENNDSAGIIRREGFRLFFKSFWSYEKIHEFFMQTLFLKSMKLTQLENDIEMVHSCSLGQSDCCEKHSEEFEREDVNENSAEVFENHELGLLELNSPEQEQIIFKNAGTQDFNDKDYNENQNDRENSGKEAHFSSTPESIISVSVAKLDKLMDLVGEMVISEAMVIQNTDLAGLELENFHKAARQLNKITAEIQDTVMSIRMVPLSTTFLKMHRIVRDMCRKLGKEIKLDINGEETEVDKNVIEHISDPLMHLVRNSIDHGIETPYERLAKEKPGTGTITLEAKNAGNDVLIIVKDDGAGLDKGKILKKAKENNLLCKPEDEMTDREIFNLILLPGFSTKDSVSEFSGRGVGMDVVTRNIEAVGGSVSIESIKDRSTAITLKIPLTLAIIDGMNIKVGRARYTLPTISIKESFRPKERDIITDPDGNVMIMVRGLCYPILRIHEVFRVKTAITDFTDGIFIMLEQDEKTICIFADELLGQQQVVVKSLPEYIKGFKKINGLAGCTLLGDGSISLILDISGLINR